MRKFIQQKLKDQKGLTLIELLAVIVILAIIAAIAIPAIGNIINNSRVGAIKSDGLNALAAAQLYLADDEDFFETTVGGTLNTDITMDELNPNYIDDEASFEGDSTFKITKNSTTGELELTAIGTIGGVEVEFNNATKAQVSALVNSADVTSGAVAENSAGVKER